MKQKHTNKSSELAQRNWLRDAAGFTAQSTVTEEQLWAYALDLLEPWEAEEVGLAVAASGETLERLERIRGSITRAESDLDRGETLARVTVSAKSAWAQEAVQRISKRLQELGLWLDAAFVQMGSVIRAGREEPDFAFAERSAVPVERWGQAASNPAKTAVIFTREGIVVRAVVVAADRTDLFLESEREIESEAEVFRIRLEHGKFYEQAVRTEQIREEKKITFANFSPGLYKIVLPQHEPIVLYLTRSMNPEQSDR